MKKFSFILFVAVAVIIGMSTTGCGDDTPEPNKTTPVDSTNTGGGEETFNNKVTVGFTDYSIVTEAARTVAIYNSANDETSITVFGVDAKEGDIDFQISFKGKAEQGYLSSASDATKVVFGLGTGTVGSAKRTEHNALSTDLTVTVTEYGAVGGKIKGVFSGKVKNNFNQTIDIKNGEFEVIRKADR